MRRFFSTRRFFLSGKNKISILNPCSSCSTIICSLLYKLMVLGLLCLLATTLLQRDKELKVSTPAPAARIFCIISTFGYRQKSTAVHVKRTWCRHCDHFLFVSDDGDEELEPALFLNINDKWQQMRAQLAYVYNYHFTDGDWFLYANDDNFVVVENLRYMLQSYSPEELIYFGCQLRSPSNQTYMYDRSGIVFSSATLQQFVKRALHNESICSSQPQGYSPTEELGRCMNNINVVAGDSRDHLGKHRFLPFELADHLTRQLNESLESHKYFLDRSYYDVNHLNVPASMHFICSKLEYMPYIYNLYYLSHQVNIFGMPRKSLEATNTNKIVDSIK